QTYNGYVMSQFKKLQADLRNKGELKWKHVMHLIRLLLGGVTVLKEGYVPVRIEEHRERLLAIKRGEVPFEEVEKWRIELHGQFDSAFETTKLPDRPDYEKANDLLIRARQFAESVHRGTGFRSMRGAKDLEGLQVSGSPRHSHGLKTHATADGNSPATEPRLQTIVRNQPYPLIFATISGAHLYGFPSPDSDYDLRGVHVLPVNRVVGLEVGMETIEVSGIHDGLEMDLVTHDVKKFMGLMLKKNGYVLEQLYSPLIVHTTPEHEELKHLGRACITKHHAHHYFGFAETQWKLFRQGISPPRQAVALCLSRAAHRDSSDENGRGGGNSAPAE
ncbi:MAG TPA: nucleotidyltransferase domain-containing protein, partial [Tepidisphaeraceae bacterium]